MPRLDDFPPKVTPNVADVLECVNACAKGMDQDVAVRLLIILGLSEPDAWSLVEPASAQYEAAVRPPPAVTNVSVTVPEGAIQMLPAPASQITVEPAKVVVREAPRGAFKVTMRHADGRETTAIIEPVE